MSYFTFFFAGAFFSNCIPHLVCGLKGEPFPSPFSKPSGIANSSPLTNFLWGSFNLFAGAFLIFWFPAVSSVLPHGLALVVGFLMVGIFDSLHFGKVHKDPYFVDGAVHAKIVGMASPKAILTKSQALTQAPGAATKQGRDRHQ